MQCQFCSILFSAVLVSSLVTSTAGVLSQEDSQDSESGDTQREMLTFELFVKNADGEPVEGAVVIPWGLRDSNGRHGHWLKGENNSGPKPATTEMDGRAIVHYPKHPYPGAADRTINVTVSVNHPDHPFVHLVPVNVPSSEPTETRLPVGTAIEVAVMLDGEQVVSDSIVALWTGGRKWNGDVGLTTTENRTYRLPPFKDGPVKFMFVRLDGTTPTHFSRIEEVVVDVAQDTIKHVVTLEPAVSLRGKLSDNVPRPVKNGQIRLRTISRDAKLQYAMG